MASDVQDPRFAPPQAHVDDVEAPTTGTELATRGSRFLAVLVDLVIAGAVLGAVTWLTPWNPWIAAGSAYWSLHVLGPTLGFAVFVGVHGWLLHTNGQTVGKRVLKIRIVRIDGSPATITRLLGLRYGVGYALALVPALGQLYGIVDALLIFRGSRRCLHDSIADTIVVKA